MTTLTTRVALLVHRRPDLTRAVIERAIVAKSPFACHYSQQYYEAFREPWLPLAAGERP